jgi:hypothetical protein
VGGQRIAVIPSQDLVVVITGSGLDANDVASLLTRATRSDAPLPANGAGLSRLNTRIAETGGFGVRYAARMRAHRGGGAVRTAALSPP